MTPMSLGLHPAWKWKQTEDEEQATSRRTKSAQWILHSTHSTARNLYEQQKQFLNEHCLSVVADSSLLNSLQRWNLKTTCFFSSAHSNLNGIEVKNLCSVHYTNHWAIEEANGVARQHCGLYPSQVLLGLRCRVRTEFRQDRGQEGQAYQWCGRPLWSALQPALVHQRVTERHYLPKEQRLIMKDKSKRMCSVVFVGFTGSFDIANWVGPQHHNEAPSA